MSQGDCLRADSIGDLVTGKYVGSLPLCLLAGQAGRHGKHTYNSLDNLHSSSVRRRWQIVEQRDVWERSVRDMGIG